MDYSYDFIYGMEDEVAAAFGIFYLIYYLVTICVGLTGYVLSSLGLYTIAKRRGISNPWLAWIPLVSVWIVGSISDQYRYVTKGQIKNKRKVLIGLAIGMFAAGAAMMAGLVALGLAGEGMTTAGIAMVLVFLVAVLAMAGLGITYAIFYYMAMYDVYTSVNPPYNVVFLVLSIIFKITEPFFIFFNRKKDKGMPPRTDVHAAPVVQPEPEFLPQPPVQEPWENVTEE